MLSPMFVRPRTEAGRASVATGIPLRRQMLMHHPTHAIAYLSLVVEVYISLVSVYDLSETSLFGQREASVSTHIAHRLYRRHTLTRLTAKGRDNLRAPLGKIGSPRIASEALCSISYQTRSDRAVIS
jgi:hypothetical protein